MAIKREITKRIELQIIIFALFSALMVTMSACGNSKNNDESTQEKRNNSSNPIESVPNDDISDSDITEPTLVIRKARANAGNKNVEVIIEIKNNPGILGIDFDLYYDDSVMTLVNAKSELNLEGCSYTPPSYYRNPTTFLWDFQDANWIEDGVVLKLYFDVAETASVGDHEIKIMYSYGNIFDADGTPIDVKVKNAGISIEE